MTYLPGFEPPVPPVQQDLFTDLEPGDSTAAVMALVDRLPTPPDSYQIIDGRAGWITAKGMAKIRSANGAEGE
jgi:hypothetical protein